LFSILGIVAFLLIITACSSSDAEDMKSQINALETQNAILQSNNIAENSQQNSGEVEAPPPPVAETPEVIEVATPQPETLPAAPVPAGQPIAYDGWSITVSKEITLLYDDKNKWGIDIIVRNLGDSSRVFRYTNASISVKDDTGYSFNSCTTQCLLHGGTSCEEYYHEVKNLMINGDDRAIISSKADYTSAGCMKEDGLGMFIGPIPMTSKQLIVHFEDFGPFTGVDVFIDL
jgi:hypothetical protein